MIIPEKITLQYKELQENPARSQQEVSQFLTGIRKNIADFDMASQIEREVDFISERFKLCQYSLHISPQIPEQVLDVDNTFYSVVNNPNFTGADFITFYQRYKAVLIKYTQDAFEVCKGVGRMDDATFEYSLSAKQLSKDELSRVASEEAEYMATVEAVYVLARQRQWEASKNKLELALLLGAQLNEKVKPLVESSQQKQKMQAARYETIIQLLESTMPQIENLDKDIKDYVDDIEEPCTSTTVDYSCDERCPNLKKWDVIFKVYRYEQDYSCLSQCNNAETAEQNMYLEEEDTCMREKRSVISKLKRVERKRNNLIDEYNDLVEELRALEASFENE